MQVDIGVLSQIMTDYTSVCMKRVYVCVCVCAYSHANAS